MMKFWVIFLTIVVAVQWYMIVWLCEEVEAIKSWKPFVDICKIKIPKENMHDK